MKKNLSVFYVLPTIGATIYILLNPFEVAYHCSYAVKLCSGSLVPSLFIFMVLSRILASFSAQGVFQNKAIVFLSRVLHLPQCLIPVCIFGLFSGAPSGAFAIADIYKKGLCTKSQAERASVLSNNCSAAFILGFAGGQFDNRCIGVFIFLANILATISVYFLLFNDKETSPKNTTENHKRYDSFTDTITGSISDSIPAVINMCGYVLFFYTLSGILCSNVANLSPISHASESVIYITKAIICLCLELTSAVLSASVTESNFAIILTASSCAFCGLSIILQLKSVFSKLGLSAKPYLLSRFLCSLLCPIYTLIMILLSPRFMMVSKIQAPVGEGITAKDVLTLCFITASAIIGAAILSHLDKKHKNK